MRKITFIALLLVGLCGCATTQSRYGNFLPPTSAAYNKTMAEDAVKQLLKLYPPASTRFDLQQTTPDNFGMTLVESMRVKGYALLESNPELPVQRNNETTNSPTGLSFTVHSGSSQQLEPVPRYTADRQPSHDPRLSGAR